MNSFLNKAYPRYIVKLRNGKNGLAIFYGKKDEDVSEASGGEKDIFNLALKIAFSKMSQLRVLILDEVDKFHSPSVAKREFSLVSDMIEDGEITQVFVVTHKPEIKTLLENDFGAHVFELKEGTIL